MLGYTLMSWGNANSEKSGRAHLRASARVLQVARADAKSNGGCLLTQNLTCLNNAQITDILQMDGDYASCIF